MFACMDASFKKVRTASLGITYTACHILGGKQTTSLRYNFKLAQYQIHHPFNILTVPNLLTLNPTTP